MIWSVASFAAAISTGIGSLFGARFLLGIGEAPTFPANSKATGYWFPKDERSLATAMFHPPAKFSSALGLPLLALLFLHSPRPPNFPPPRSPTPPPSPLLLPLSPHPTH